MHRNGKAASEAAGARAGRGEGVEMPKIMVETRREQLN